jgi:hypothetical protein
MSSIQQQFHTESQKLLFDLFRHLDKCTSLNEAPLLSEFAQIIDRIMGGARSIAEIHGDETGYLDSLGDHAETLKKMCGKTVKLKNNEELFKKIVQHLREASIAMQKQLEDPKNNDYFFDPKFKIKADIINEVLDKELNVAVPPPNKMTQAEIDKLMEKLNKS